MFDFLRQLITRHFGLKVLSLAVAMLLWWTVAHEPEAQVLMNVPIEFYQVPKGLEFSAETIPQVQIRVRGPARVLRELAQRDIHPVIDLSGATQGERTYPIRARSIQLPKDAVIEQIIPAQLRLSLDRPDHRVVPVRARITGALVSGFSIVAATVEPPTVQIEGPSRRVALIDSAFTDPVDATGVIGTATFTTNVYTTDPLVKVSNPQPARVTVVTQKSPSNAGVE
ncbi:MAG: CdaR family protein [Candidatus Korobacteraceae bacterium]|jgi:YbbR domain-containing protein